jgi:hypothetical protein
MHFLRAHLEGQLLLLLVLLFMDTRDTKIENLSAQNHAHLSYDLYKCKQHKNNVKCIEMLKHQLKGLLTNISHWTDT